MLTPSQFPNTYPDDTAKLSASSSRRFSRPDDRKHRKRSKICRIRTAIYKTCLPNPSAPSCLRLSPDEEGGPLPLASGGPPGPPEAAPRSLRPRPPQPLSKLQTQMLRSSCADARAFLPWSKFQVFGQIFNRQDSNHAPQGTPVAQTPPRRLLRSPRSKAVPIGQEHHAGAARGTGDEEAPVQLRPTEWAAALLSPQGNSGIQM